ncbi:phosphoribosylglycinamide formyltransferase [Chitinophagaceae bacterium IBVUCB1]|nr:phosphoribosylglycinamide formyltransferase [Chitinophagaceae bacterium IBVUCB1]
MHSLIIFASGRGSNAQAIIDYFKANGKARVSLIVSNKADAGVLDIARKENIPYIVVDKQTVKEVALVQQIEAHNPSLIILAGYLWKVPDSILNAFPNKIINVHPALLPAYGGKGMYGHHVHEAVVANAEKESGITIHYVNEHYDEGSIIVQARCCLAKEDTPDSLAQKIHKLEHFFFPRTIEFLLDNA